MAHSSKLMRAQEQAGKLRGQVRELRETVDELSEPNPSTLRQFVSVPIIDGTAWAGSFTYVKLQKMGWMPKRFPVDGTAGASLQLLLAFFHGPIASVFRDMAHGMTAGAAGRIGGLQAMETVETEKGPAKLLPGQSK